MSNDGLAPIALPSRIGRYERRMKWLQQLVSGKKRGSANRKKAVARLGAVHALIAIESLAVKSTTAAAAGTAEAPGKNVRARPARTAPSCATAGRWREACSSTRPHDQA